MRKEVKASKKYWFVSGEELRNGCAFDAFLFNDPDHLVLQPCKNRYSYYLLKKHEEIIHARCTFFIENNIAYSPYKSSFGSIEFSTKVFFELLEEYWDNIEADLRALGVKEIIIKNYPVCYNPPHAQMLSFLFATKGFEIKTQELNFHIEVDDVEFERKVHENERKKLNKSLKENLVFRREEKYEISEIHSFVDNSRKRRCYPTTMSEKQLRDVFSKFPKEFLLFTVSNHHEWIALLVVVVVNNSILYTFYGADNENFSSYSPLVLLHFYLYSYSRGRNYKIIDLGIGSYMGLANKGLVRFKEKLGGCPSLKTILRKKFND